MSGEYISRESLGLTDFEIIMCDGDYKEGLKLLLEKIENAPSADVAPVRHGRWIKDGEDGPVCCSECGEEHEWGDYRASYCDTCGAKMDGEQDE